MLPASFFARMLHGGTVSPVSGYAWDSVSHKKRQFSKRDEIGVNVSTNYVEGLFGRVKKHNRWNLMGYIGKNHYGIHLAEYLWQERSLHHQRIGTHQWHGPAFFCALVRHLSSHHEEQLFAQVPGRMKCPQEFVPRDRCSVEVCLSDTG